MRLLNTLLRPKTSLIIVLLLSLAVTLVSISPLIKTGTGGVFFAFDPDVIYVANALSNIKNGSIHYFDHPGILTIFTLSYVLLPLRVLANISFQTNFILWAAQNYQYIFLYLRITQSFLFTVSLFIFLYAILKLSGSKLSVIFSALALLVFMPFYYLGLSISAETLNFLLVALWCLVLALYLEKKDRKNLFLSFLAGIAFANRATSLFLVPASLMIAASQGGNFKKRTAFLFLNILSVFSGYIAGIWPLKERALTLLNRVFFFASYTGVHGAGLPTFFDPKSYLDSLKTLVTREYMAILILSFLAMGALFFTLKKAKGLKENYLLALVFMVGFLIFAKFDLSHYQTTNYFVLIFLGSAFFSQLVNRAKIVIIFILLLGSFPFISRYWAEVSKGMLEISTLESFQEQHPSQKGEVWEWARSRDFAVLWSRSWAGGIFDAELKTLRPPLYDLGQGFKTVKVSYVEEKPLFETCWDQLYIQEVSLEQFLKVHPERKFRLTRIIGTQGIILIESDHCIVKT